MKNFTINYSKIKKKNIKKFSKKYKRKWFNINVYLKFLKFSLLQKKNLKKYIILRRKIRYSTKKKKAVIFNNHFKSRRERYLLKDWRKWKRNFVHKFKFSFLKKSTLKIKIKNYKYNIYNLNKKVIINKNLKKFKKNYKKLKIKQNNRKFNISNSKLNSMEDFMWLIVKQPYDMIEEEQKSKIIGRFWFKRKKMLKRKRKRKKKLTRKTRRKLKKWIFFKKNIKIFKKKCIFYFWKLHRKKLRKKKFKRLRRKYKKLKDRNNYSWIRKTIAKYNAIFKKKKKQLFLHFLLLDLKNSLKNNFFSNRQEFNLFYLKVLLKNKIKKKFHKRTYIHKKLYKLRKYCIIFFTQEIKIRKEKLNFKKKKSIKLIKFIKTKKFYKKFIKRNSKYRLRIKVEIFKNYRFKFHFYKNLMNKFWKKKNIMTKEEKDFLTFEKGYFTSIKKKPFYSSSLQYLNSKASNQYIQKKKKKKFLINDYLYLNDESLESYSLKFHMKEFKIINESLIQQIKKKIFFFNLNVEKLSIFREARKTHWKFFTNKKLKNFRYQKFLNFFLKKTNLFFNKIFTYFQFQFNFSYQFWVNFNLLYQKYFKLDINYKKIFQFPIHWEFWQIFKQYNLQGLKNSLKISSWQIKKVKIKKTFWMQQKIKLPKYLKKKIFSIESVINCIQFDFITNYFIILKTLREFSYNNFYIFKNKHIKSHGFKYNS